MPNKINDDFNQHLLQLLSALSVQNDIETTTKTRLVVALSGGVDSVVLLHLLVHFQKAYPSFTVLAHNVNHGLSANAHQWTLFCEKLCAQFNVPFISSSVHLEKKSQTSLEAVAREARYQVFQDKMQINDIILTGHHQDDQLETLLLALKRGSGSTGLQGIRIQQNFAIGFLLRPLLIYSRQQLLDYAQLHELQWTEDESNQNIEFDRNFIRHQISPLLTARWPSIANSASRTAQLCQDQQSLLDEVANEDLNFCLVEKFTQKTLSICKLLNFSDARRNNLIRHWLKVNGLQYPSHKQLQILWQEVALAKADKQPALQLSSHSVCRYQGHLYLVLKQPFILPKQPITWRGESKLWLDEGRFAVDFSNLPPQLAEQYNITCCLRSHLDSKLMCLPEGRNKSRSIKKLLHEFQVPPWLRDQVVFVLIEGVLVEAIGLWRCQLNDNLPQIEAEALSLYFT